MDVSYLRMSLVVSWWDVGGGVSSWSSFHPPAVRVCAYVRVFVYVCARLCVRRDHDSGGVGMRIRVRP